MFTTTPAPLGRPAVPRRAGRFVVSALFVVMAALLLAAILIPLLADPGPVGVPRPAPAPAPVLPR
jgi:hypothetical protein